MGSSGSGKSTLLRLIARLETPFDRNSLFIEPRDAVISLVPQSPILFEHLSPRDNAYYFERISSMEKRFQTNSKLKILAQGQFEIQGEIPDEIRRG